MVGFFWKDPKSGVEIQTGNTRTLFLHDFTWMGIRKGGERFWTFANFSGGWRLFSQREDMNALLQVPQPLIGLNTVQGNAVPRGLTNDKKHMVFVTHDTTLAVADRLQYNDINGNLLTSYALTDGLVNKLRQIVFLEHDYYIIREVDPDVDSGAVHIYSKTGVFIRSWLLPTVPPEFPQPTYRGITTDGKFLYINRVDQPSQVMLKFDVQGNLLRQYSLGSPLDGLRPRWPITFNGRYLLIQHFFLGPG